MVCRACVNDVASPFARFTRNAVLPRVLPRITSDNHRGRTWSRCQQSLFIKPAGRETAKGIDQREQEGDCTYLCGFTGVRPAPRILDPNVPTEASSPECESPRGMLKSPPGVHARISFPRDGRTTSPCHASVATVGFRFRADRSGITARVVKTRCATTTAVAAYVIVEFRKEAEVS